MIIRVCAECRREFQPSSGHLRCPSCRSHNVCACGARKQVHSATCSACRTESGTSNSNWRGGRTRHMRGYVMVWAPEHPRAGKGSYVFEHVLVMEEMLGRHLGPGENVHHRNGVRDDNRPENLELWTRPQPTGIRASDAVAWAREIITRYGDESPHAEKATTRLPNASPVTPRTLTGHYWRTLEDRGDGGNRTPVLRDLSRSSPSAACFAFLSPGDHAGKTPTGSATV
jgi:hypothetical protein